MTDMISRAAAIAANPIETAPKDGTMLRLLVDYTDDGANPLEDEHQAWTIGFNQLSDTEEDVWEFAGWSWEQDCFTEGQGRVIGWLPFHALPAAQVAVKLLEWEHHPMGWLAAPPTGQSYIIDVRVKGRVMFIKGMNPPPKFDNLEAAKAAAQADYETRVRSALTITPAQDSAQIRADALREAADKLKGQGYNTAVRQILAMIDISPATQVKTAATDYTLGAAELSLPAVSPDTGKGKVQAEPLTETQWSAIVAHFSYELEPRTALPNWNTVAMEAIRLRNQLSTPANLHAVSQSEHYDDYAISQFAKMMSEKMAASRVKGRSGWNDPEKCSVDYLRSLLYEHLDKGDPVDVANICMMLRHYEASTYREFCNCKPAVSDDVAAERERIAAWHDREAMGAMNGLHCGSENSEYRAANRLHDFHKTSAAAIRGQS